MKVIPYLLPLVAATLSNLHDSQTVRQQSEAAALSALADQNLRLVSLNDHDAPRWVMEDDKEALRRLGLKFMDITDHPDLGHQNAIRTSSYESPYPKKMKQEKIVKE